jgi:hypothetical protein
VKQAEDAATLELPGLDVTQPKRGRGRPRKDHPLTPAQRAKRYRDKKTPRTIGDMAKLMQSSWFKGYCAKYGCYFDPVGGQTWTGRGKPPAWVRLKQSAGVDMAQYWRGPA